MYFYYKGREFSVKYNENGDIKLSTTKIAFKSMMQNGFMKYLMKLCKNRMMILIKE